MREDARTKGLRYLTEGRLWIRSAGPGGITAVVTRFFDTWVTYSFLDLAPGRVNLYVRRDQARRVHHPVSLS